MFLIPPRISLLPRRSDEVGGSQVTGYRGLGPGAPAHPPGPAEVDVPGHPCFPGRGEQAFPGLGEAARAASHAAESR
jgi:hypothetical protein